MKKIYQIIACVSLLLFTSSIFAQSDTLFFMNFQTDPSSEMAIFPESGETDSIWVNYDEDGIAAEGGVPQNYYFDLDWGSPDSIPVTDSNFVFTSRSWLAGFDTSSSNWLISPAMQIVDANATLHWKSASYQGPRYMDGYAVKILVGSQDVTEIGTTVTEVFRAAEMTEIIGESGSVDPSNFLFSNGYIHADGYTLTDYFIPADTAAGETIHIGLLEPHSFSLADYSGQTIYIAWHHDSADDNLFMIDDLLLLGTEPVSGTQHPVLADLRFVTYPNPVDNFLNVMFRLNNPAKVQIEIVAQDGKRVAAKATKHTVSGDFTEQFDFRNLPSGAYAVVLMVDNQRFVKNILRK